MIARLTGTLARLGTGYLVIDVAGIGYKVFATPKTIEYTSLASRDGACMLETYHAVREDASDLYGFSSQDELEMFELLLSLSGVGPKSALGILSLADPDAIRHAVTNDDAGYLTKLSGVGKKTAEKIVVGLRDKLGAHSGTPGDHRSSSLVIDALLALGYSAEDARDALKRSDTTKPPEDQVRDALRLLARP
jgi:Holliday junction DNA helicase RuvA